MLTITETMQASAFSQHTPSSAQVDIHSARAIAALIKRVLLQLNSEQYTVMKADKVVQSVTTDTRVVHQQVSSPSAAPTATTASSSSATATPAATPQATTAASLITPSPATAATATPAATAIPSSTAAAAAPSVADTSSTVPSAGTVANSSTAANATGAAAAGGGVTRVSTLQTQLKAPWDLDTMDQISLPLDGKYEYTNDGTGVNVYILDTVRAKAKL